MKLLSCVIPLLVATGQNTVAQEQTYRFQKRVDVVAVDVAVTDEGRPVDGLSKDDFEIRDNGVMQEIDRVQVESAPVDAILILDTSKSVAGPKLEDLRAAVGDFIAGLKDGDLVALVTFSGYVRLRQSLTTDRSVLRDALAGIDARGLTALKDGLYGGLSLAGPSAQRPIAVLFSDGLDNASWITEPEILEVVRESNAVVYVVCSSQSPLESRDFSSRASWHSDFRRRYYRYRFLRRVAEDSGGRFFEIDDASSMEKEFRRVVEDIRSRYLLTYYPTGVADDGWHDLEVKLRSRKAELRARQGYYVEPVHQ